MHINPGTYKTILAPKNKKKKKPQDPKRWGAVKRKREREKQPQKLPKLYQTHAAGKYFSK